MEDGAEAAGAADDAAVVEAAVGVREEAAVEVEAAGKDRVGAKDPSGPIAARVEEHWTISVREARPPEDPSAVARIPTPVTGVPTAAAPVEDLDAGVDVDGGRAPGKIATAVAVAVVARWLRGSPCSSLQRSSCTSCSSGTARMRRFSQRLSSR